MFSKNTSQQVKTDVCALLDGVKEKQKAKYLGSPLVIGRAKKEVFGYITEAVAKKMANSKDHFLSHAGKEVLLKSVISAMLIYAMSCIRLPGYLGREVKKLSSKFW